MKRTHFFSITFLLGALLVLGAVKASAQGSIAPSGQLGIGVSAGTSVAATIQYAINPAVQIGAGVGYNKIEDVSRSAIELYGRFLFEGQVNPFVQAGIRLTSNSTTSLGVTTSSSTNFIFAGVGLEYFVNRNVGVYGMVDVLDIQLDPSATSFGLSDSRIGLEWYFK